MVNILKNDLMSLLLFKIIAIILSFTILFLSSSKTIF